MKNRTWIKLPTLGLCCLALGLVYCGGEEENEPPDTKTDGGMVLPDAGIQPETDAGVTPGTDAGEEPQTDGGTDTDGGVVLQELQNVTLRDIRANTGTYVNLETRKSLAIVNVTGVRVVSDYAHTDGNHSVYIEQGSGAERAGMLFYISPDDGVTIPAVGSTMDIRGCVNSYFFTIFKNVVFSYGYFNNHITFCCNCNSAFIVPINLSTVFFKGSPERNLSSAVFIYKGKT